MDKTYTEAPMKMKLGAEISAPSCFTRLDDSIAQLRGIRNRVSALSDALVGSDPESPSMGGAVKGGDGRFDQVDRAAGDIYELCDQITGWLIRIESRL